MLFSVNIHGTLKYIFANFREDSRKIYGNKTVLIYWVSAIISPSRTDTKSIISPAAKLSPKMLKKDRNDHC